LLTAGVTRLGFSHAEQYSRARRLRLGIRSPASLLFSGCPSRHLQKADRL
jgi:hypothetical protein